MTSNEKARQETEEAWRGRWERQSQTSAEGENRRVEQEYFHILLRELRIYLNQTRDDCWKTNQDYFGEFYFVYVKFTLSVLYYELTGQFM